MIRIKNQSLVAISLSQFGMAMTVHFVMVFMPFYVLKISPYSHRETLIWLGLIMGANSFVVTIASNLWGRLTSRYSPKLLYLRGAIVYTFVFLFMGFTSNLPLLLILRILQGLFGGISTIALIIIASSSPRDRIGADIGFFQTLQTLGHLVGPVIGSYTASALGYRGAFIVASAMVLAVAIFCHLQVADVPKTPKDEKTSQQNKIGRESFLGWLLILMVTIQLTFLPSVLPKVFEAFQLDNTTALKWAGTVVLLYTATATAGTFGWSRLTLRFKEGKLILFLVTAGTCFQALLALSRGLVDFAIIRMVQTGFIAATVPLVLSVFAAEVRGGTIGFLNSARFAAGFVGPILATSVLAFSSLTALYLVISGMTLFALVAFRQSLKDRRGTEGKIALTNP